LESRLGIAKETRPPRTIALLHLDTVHRPLDVADARRDHPPGDEAGAEGIARGGADEQPGLEILRQPLHPAGEVDGVAERAVLELERRSGVADLGRPSVDAD